VDLADRVERAQSRRYALLEEQAEQVAVRSADLLADYHVHAELGVLARPLARPKGAPDLVVIGDGDDVDALRRHGHNVLRALGAVAPERVHVQVGAAVRTRPHHARVCRRTVNGLPLSA
jgi:hypothetical protein